MTDLMEDLRRTWRPSDTALTAAVHALEARPDADVAVVPLYQPGKRYGQWTLGQRVCSVEAEPDQVLLAMKGRVEDGDVPGLHIVRDTAFDLAMAALRGHGDGKGTTAYAIVRRDRTFTVFEEILSAVD